MNWESSTEVYILPQSQWEFALWCRQLNPVLSDNLEWWDGVGGGKEVQEGGNILIPVHVDVWQKLYNIVKFQLKINKLRHAKKKKENK